MAAEQHKVGVIGLGLVGIELAGRLRSHGQLVLGWDVEPARCALLSQLGGQIAASNAAVFAECRIVLLSLPTHEIVRQVLESQTLRPGQCVLDTSTGLPAAAEAMAKRVSQYQAEYVDATISGSSAQVAQGTAVWFVGCSPSGLQQVRPLLDMLTPNWFEVGLPGAGSRMKLVTNLVLGLNRAALAEGLVFAERQGLDLHKTLEMLRHSMAYSRIMDTKGEKMVDQDFRPQAKLSQHLKDVRLILECGHQCGQALPLSEAHLQLLLRAEQLGLGGLDNSALINAYRQ
jgi:3-hydroxyisobutyrate dehydrogenase-like beta-hydroxyacid dehydrogenase